MIFFILFFLQLLKKKFFFFHAVFFCFEGFFLKKINAKPLFSEAFEKNQTDFFKFS
uniref:Uncharacterized protein n=1 Tax=Chlorella vulgaris TaxID=3077 RepID=V9H1A7_CHLVU|nr:hypothetical protein ChvulCp144 [Chlorella vulgaris]pir/T07330/ hypothetical protein 55c - Chlorella vulgaris chloroplast [Chlorella vulgaris]BAA57978.1 unnamed protein product [Chlorella vulgaris]